MVIGRWWLYISDKELCGSWQNNIARNFIAPIGWLLIIHYNRYNLLAKSCIIRCTIVAYALSLNTVFIAIYHDIRTWPPW